MSPSTGAETGGAGMPARSRRWPLRRRLLVALVLLCAAGLVAFGGFGVLLLERSLIRRADVQLTEIARGMRHDPPPPPPREPSPDSQLPTEFSMSVFSSSGALRWRAPAEASGGPVLPDELIFGTISSPTTVRDRSRDVEWRAVSTQRSNGDRVVIAVSLEGEQATVNQLLLIELVTGALILVVAALVGWVMVRLGLSPLTRMERTATSIADGNVELRVTDTDKGTETGQLGRALNTMLERLGQALRDRERSEQRLRRFVADASHELRTPLTSIRGFAELYRQGSPLGDPELQARIVRRVEDEADRMGVMVEDLLLLARLDQERALDLSEVDLKALVTDVVHDARVRHPDAELVLAGPGQRIRVVGDEHRLHQVLANLVGNAVTHSPPGTTVWVRVDSVMVAGPPAGVTSVGSRRRLGVVGRVEVRDDGPGIDAEHLPHLFDRFYRADPARPLGGTGLGLAIAAALVEAHGGRIEVESEPGQGTVFRVLLPRTGPDTS